MNEELIPPLCGWIKKQLHYPIWNIKTIIKSLFTNDIEERIMLLNDCKYVLLTDSGSTALTLGLQQLIPRKVYMPSYCCKTVANAIINANKQPHFYDITKHLQPKPIQKKAIIIVPHYYGKKAPITKFKGTIIDDKAQRIQDPLQGEFGILSFNIGKQIQSTGGGALITNNEIIYRKAKNKLSPQTGHEITKQLINYILTVNLRKITMFTYNILIKLKILHREENITKRYQETNQKTTIFRPKTMNWIQKKITQAQLMDLKKVLKPRTQTILVPNRYQTLKNHSKQGIEVDWTFYPLHLQKKYSKYPKQKLTNTEQVWKKTITIRTK